MLTTTLYTKLGEAVGTVDLPEALFGAPVNTAVLHQVVTAQLAGRHLGTHDTKTRGEVRGGGAKPYRQKGTGRARQGSKRAPHYAGGGVVFGPHPRSYDQKVPRRMKRLALRGALTAKYGDGAIKVVQDLAMEAIRTRELLDYLEALESATGEILVVAQARDEKLELSARNLPHVSIILADSLNTVDILKARVLLITEPALAAMTEVYA
jgi:large subunit ribosomal protein L4